MPAVPPHLLLAITPAPFPHNLREFQNVGSSRGSLDRRLFKAQLQPPQEPCSPLLSLPQGQALPPVHTQGAKNQATQHPRRHLWNLLQKAELMWSEPAGQHEALSSTLPPLSSSIQVHLKNNGAI